MDSIRSCEIFGESIGVRWDTCAWRSMTMDVESQCAWALVQSYTAAELNNQVHCHEGGDNGGGSGPSPSPSPSPSPPSLTPSSCYWASETVPACDFLQSAHRWSGGAPQHEHEVVDTTQVLSCGEQLNTDCTFPVCDSLTSVVFVHIMEVEVRNGCVCWMCEMF